MCGINGILELAPAGRDPRPIVKAQTRRLVHRGPDDEGFYDDGPIHFGFRRLSILDLSPAGHQPMSTEDGSHTIIFNGEIYNYRELADELRDLGYTFRSRSDTEVILKAYQAWGPGCVKRFNGMWGLAIWDKRQQRLFCSRDRFGVKPFYYHRRDDQFVFASEIKALLAHPDVPREADERRLYDYLVYGYFDHTDETTFRGIRQLPPGHSLLIDQDGRLTIERYWSLDPNRRTTLATDKAYADRFYELFEDGIRLRLRSDVPVGTCLSGGLDSSSIACVVNELLRREKIENIGERQKTFSAVYEDKSVDEREYSQAVVAQTGAAAFLIFPTAQDILRDMPRVVYHQDEPFGSTSIFAQWYVMQRAHAEGMKVMLDGQGADELLAGYHPYFGPYLASLLRQGRLLRVLGEVRQWKRHHGYPLSYFMTQVAAGALSKLLPRPIITGLVAMTKQNGSLFLRPDFLRQYETGQPQVRGFRDPLQNELHRVLTIGLPALLHYEDRNSMAWSIEARVPFLDYRLVEFMFSIPNRFKIADGTTKVVLRQAMKNILPAKVRTRQSKLGFATPEQRWFRESFQTMARDVLTSESFRGRGIIDADRALALFDGYVAGKAKFGIGPSTIWRWVNLELWFRTFIDQVPAVDLGVVPPVA